MDRRLDRLGKGSHLSQFLGVGPANAPAIATRIGRHHTSNRHDHQRARFRPHECETTWPLLEAIERRATRLVEVPADSRIGRGRTSLHALAQLIERAL
jgi:hypothetical protein